MAIPSTKDPYIKKNHLNNFQSVYVNKDAYDTLKKGIHSKDFTKIAIIHFNPLLNDPNRNIERLSCLAEKAAKKKVDIILTPELATSGFCLQKDNILQHSENYTSSALKAFEALAKKNQTSILIGSPQITSKKVKNAVLVFGPKGFLFSQEKRGSSGWHEAGDSPLNTFDIDQGKVGSLVCSDIFLPDCSRILALKGAKIITVIANWWTEGLEDICKVRAIENQSWVLVANRWGLEVDTRYKDTYSYDMNTAESMVIDPSGKTILKFNCKQGTGPRDSIIFAILQKKSSYRNSFNISYIQPLAYRGLLENSSSEKLPSPKISIGLISYIPEYSWQINLDKVKSTWNKFKNKELHVLTIPSMGISTQKLSLFELENQEWFKKWQDFVTSEKIPFLITTIMTDHLSQMIIVFSKDQPYFSSYQIHSSTRTIGHALEPRIFKIFQTKLAIVEARDMIFPELGIILAKKDVDVIIIPSSITKTSDVNNNYFNTFWDFDDFVQLLKISTNQGFHFACSDWSGNGAVIKKTKSGWPKVISQAPEQEKKIVKLSRIENRTLNTHIKNDVDTLLHL